MQKFFQSAAIGWLGRRALDWGGWIGTIIAGALAFYATLTPQMQELLSSLLSRRWDEITLGALWPFLVLVFSQVMSFRATVKPQVVTEDGIKLDPKKDLKRGERAELEAIAETGVAKKAARQPNLLERLFGKSR